ncbi:unnamed protein product, partial [Rotaria sp. Silwood1]
KALHALDRYRLFGRELKVEFAREDRRTTWEMRAREKETRYRCEDNVGRHDRSRSRARRRRSAFHGARDRRRGSGRKDASRSRSAHSHSPVSRR